MVKALALGALLALAACQTASGTFCAIAKPHPHSPATVDAMTDAEVERELQHNELGRRLCSWRP